MFSKDLIPIIHDIKLAHSKDHDTADDNLSVDDLERMEEAIKSQKTLHGRLHELAKMIAVLVRAKQTDQNMDSAEAIVNSGAQNKDATEMLLSQSEYIEPDARKRRRNR